MNEMKTGFIILNYNSYKLTQQLAKIVKNFDEVDLVLIVDNKSSDD